MEPYYKINDGNLGNVLSTTGSRDDDDDDETNHHHHQTHNMMDIPTLPSHEQQPHHHQRQYLQQNSNSNSNSNSNINSNINSNLHLQRYYRYLEIMKNNFRRYKNLLNRLKEKEKRTKQEMYHKQKKIYRIQQDVVQQQHQQYHQHSDLSRKEELLCRLQQLKYAYESDHLYIRWDLPEEENGIKKKMNRIYQEIQCIEKRINEILLLHHQYQQHQQQHQSSNHLSSRIQRSTGRSEVSSNCHQRAALYYDTATATRSTSSSTTPFQQHHHTTASRRLHTSSNNSVTTIPSLQHDDDDVVIASTPRNRHRNHDDRHQESNISRRSTIISNTATMTMLSSPLTLSTNRIIKEGANNSADAAQQFRRIDGHPDGGEALHEKGDKSNNNTNDNDNNRKNIFSNFERRIDDDKENNYDDHDSHTGTKSNPVILDDYSTKLPSEAHRTTISARSKAVSSNTSSTSGFGDDLLLQLYRGDSDCLESLADDGVLLPQTNNNSTEENANSAAAARMIYNNELGRANDSVESNSNSMNDDGDMKNISDQIASPNVVEESIKKPNVNELGESDPAAIVRDDTTCTGNDASRQVRDEITSRKRSYEGLSEKLVRHPDRYISDPTVVKASTSQRPKKHAIQTNTERKNYVGFIKHLLKDKKGQEQCFEEARAKTGSYTLLIGSSNNVNVCKADQNSQMHVYGDEEAYIMNVSKPDSLSRSAQGSALSRSTNTTKVAKDSTTKRKKAALARAGISMSDFLSSSVQGPALSRSTNTTKVAKDSTAKRKKATLARAGISMSDSLSRSVQGPPLSRTTNTTKVAKASTTKWKKATLARAGMTVAAAAEAKKKKKTKIVVTKHKRDELVQRYDDVNDDVFNVTAISETKFDEVDVTVLANKSSTTNTNNPHLLHYLRKNTTHVTAPTMKDVVQSSNDGTTIEQ